MKSDTYTNQNCAGYVPSHHTEKFQYHRRMSRSFIQREAYDSASVYLPECRGSGRLSRIDVATWDSPCSTIEQEAMLQTKNVVDLYMA